MYHHYSLDLSYTAPWMFYPSLIPDRVSTSNNESIWIQHPGASNSVAFTPDGLTLSSGSMGGRIYIYNATTGELLKNLPTGFAGVSSVVFDPQNGNRLASGLVSNPEVPGLGPGRVWIWDVANERPENVFMHDAVVLAIAYDARGDQLAAAGQNGIVKVWNTRDLGLSPVSLKASGITQSVSFSPDGRRVAAGTSRGDVNVWDIATGALVRTLPTGAGVKSIAYHPHLPLLAAGNDAGKINIWDTDRLAVVRELEHLPLLDGYPGMITSVVWDSTGVRLVSGTWDGAIKIWDMNTGNVLEHVQPGMEMDAYGRTINSAGGILSLAISRNQKLAIGANAGFVNIRSIP